MRTLADAQPLEGELTFTAGKTAVRGRASVRATTAYVGLGVVLILSRLVGLRQSFWTDEVVTVTDYIRAGPEAILTGPYIPNNHQLFSILGWLTSSLFGESEVALRLLAVVPFVAGVAVVTAWLHLRRGPLSGVLFLFFATASPLLFDLSRQARGYGLAFLAMAVMIVAALEAERTGSTWLLAGFFAGGLVGTLTLPNFALAFFATALAVAATHSFPRRAAFGIAGSTLVIAVWYAPHLDDLLKNSQQENGTQISWLGLITSPIERVLMPGLLWFGDTFLDTTTVRVLIMVVAAVLLLSSPLIRTRNTALLFSSGTAATLFFVWLTRLYLAPRFVSFLLVPLLILLATGAAEVLSNARLRPRPRALAAMLAIAMTAAAFVGAAAQLLRYPAEAWKDAAAAIETPELSGQPVFAHVSRPHGLRYYLPAPVTRLRPSQVVSSVCRADRAVVYVENSFENEPVVVPCLQRDGVRHIRLRQHSYGGEVNVWLVPVGR